MYYFLSVLRKALIKCAKPKLRGPLPF